MGVGVEGERSPPAQPSSHIWSMASGCKNWLINAPQICSRAWSAQSELEVASRQGKHSQHRGVFLFQRCIWGFASRAVRKFLGTSAFASSPLWRAVGRNIARWSQNGESQTKCVLQFATGLRAAAKSNSDSEGLWVARNLAFL